MGMIVGFILGIFTYRVVQLLFHIAEDRRTAQRPAPTPQPDGVSHY